MKLSAAMRAGMKITKRAEGVYYENGAACALGAAVVGHLGHLPSDGALILSHEILALYPRLEDRADTVPPGQGHRRGWKLFDHIVSLNDKDHWDRGRIARWLESLGL